MDIRSLRQAREFALTYGAKSVIYGGPGSGKTPIINTAPRPVMLACEPGLLSMRNSSVPTFFAPDADKIDEFFKWFFHSKEPEAFDTLALDSVSQMCELYLQRAQKQNKHGLAAYGQMARDVMSQLNPLFYMQKKHAYLIAKQQTLNSNGSNTKIPYFPGQQLPVDVPHLYDFILHLDTQNVPGVGQVKAFRCIGSMDTVARNRTGNLDEFEPPHFGNLVTKAMSV